MNDERNMDVRDDVDAESFRVVLCGANAYEKKYYFNNKFDKIPENIKEELHIICVLFTEEVGGIFTIGFTPYGEVEMDTQKEEGDLLYDDIGAELLQLGTQFTQITEESETNLIFFHICQRFLCDIM